MDHRKFIRTLTAEQRRILTKKSNIEGFKVMTVHVSGIVIAGLLIAFKGPAWQLLLPVQGVLLVFLFTLMHEAIHRTAFESRRINDWVAYGCSLVLALPTEWFRQFHLAHHRHTQDMNRDPELSAAKPTTLRGYLVYVSGIPVWFGNRGRVCEFYPRLSG